MTPNRTTASAVVRRALLGLLGVALLVTAACGAPAQGGGTTDTTLTVAISNNPSSLDPQAGPSGTDHVALYPIYATLVDFDPATLKATPGLAESWSFTDPTTLQLKLRSGLKFSDGSPLDAAAVKASLERYRTQTNKADLSNVTAVDAPDPTTVVIREKTPDSSLVLVLADRAGMIVGPTAANADFAQKPVGAGPYTLVSYSPGDRLVLKRNPNYFGTAAPMENLEMRIITDPKAAANALLSGQIDFADNLDANDIPQLKNSGKLTVESPVGLWFDMIYFNLSQKPLDDVRVRQAINLALDRDEIIQGTVNGQGEPARQPLPTSHWAYDKANDGIWPHDVAKAKQLMADAGYAGGVTLTSVATASPLEIRRNEIIRSQLAQIGIDYKVTPMDTNQGVSLYFEKQGTNAAQYAWSGRPDPGQTYNRLFAQNSYQNPGKVAVPGLDQVLTQAVSTEDTTQRAAAYAQADKLIADFAPYAPLYFRGDVTAYSTSVTGYTASLLGKPKVAFLNKSSGA
ncbi:ABC transporter substrate-binding protein [Pseudonocardia sp. RS11V-5]|uniref:ABC transporter substrate-binding protein n=1 Tax=Pseudonocardia terrae TaxID=2905831 RepID=UPI001E4B8CC9|nr:ABC transporter substrate-binding protein [Pseudonocardia terrae]MCE3554648.1 ABC transporter substrate-binding protein [Pseudonocardia terrae]